VDLYQIHRFDPETPIEETVDALHDVVRAGKARYIGACTMAAWQLAKAQHAAERHGWTRFSSMQSRCNLICREDEREMIPFCVDQGVGVIAYSPLARGLLAGTRSRDGQPLTTRARTDPVHGEAYGTSSRNEVVRRVADVAENRGVPPAQVALAWTLHKPGVNVALIGASKPSHIDDAAAAAALTLTAEEIASLEEPYLPYWGLGARQVGEPPLVGASAQPHADALR
jgi:aryl-alcohol dehydrogenase-like predicted oxidoreductase